MKKFLSLLLALSLLCAGTALADITADDETGSTTVTYIVPEPGTSYTIIIPPTLTIAPNATSTTLTVQLTEEKNVKSVSVETAASGSMTNGNGGAIDFTVTSNELTFSNFKSLPSSKVMTINITAEEWQQVPAGTYTGTMSFTISAQ